MSSTAVSHLNEMRQKYQEERDKRIREEGNEQYIEVAGDFAVVVAEVGQVAFEVADTEVEQLAYVRKWGAKFVIFIPELSVF